MKTRTFNNLAIVYDPEEELTADLIEQASDEALRLAKEMWGLEAPQDCRIYVMTSSLGFIFRSAPWPWRIMLGVTLPLWYWRVNRSWPISAAWTQRYGHHVAIGIKPPRFLERSDRRIGTRMFVEQQDMNVNVQLVTCHELVHACSAHLRLPAWFNEGIAVLTADRYLGKQTIRQDTLAHLRDSSTKEAPPTYRELSRMDPEAILYHATRGYWLLRYLEDQHPGSARSMLAKDSDSKQIEAEIAKQLGMEPNTLWSEIDEVVVRHFESGEVQNS
ncbi:MAG: hypothetical protein PVG14_03955 [Anaerolineales bacterium]|jgi:hypothetical protein